LRAANLEKQHRTLTSLDAANLMDPIIDVVFLIVLRKAGASLPNFWSDCREERSVSRIQGKAEAAERTRLDQESGKELALPLTYSASTETPGCLALYGTAQVWHGHACSPSWNHRSRISGSSSIRR
jgi:hypothetical protein